MSPAVTRQAIAILSLLLFLGSGLVQWPTPASLPPAAVVEEVAEPTDNLYAQQRSDRTVEAWRESLAQALVATTHAEESTAREIACGIYQTSLQKDTDPLRIAGFVVAESYGNPKAVSHKDAHGLMQILPETGKFIAYHSGDKWRGVNSLYEIKTSIDYGVWYYEYLLGRLDDNEHAAMAAYNWGPRHIERRLRSHRGLPVVYPGKVLTAQEKVRNAFRDEYRKRTWWARDPRMDYPDYGGESNSDACPDQPPEPVVESPRALT